MTLSDEQIQELLRVGNPTDEEYRLIRIGWDAAMRTQGIPDGYKLMPVEPTKEIGYSENRVEFEGCTATRREHESQT